MHVFDSTFKPSYMSINLVEHKITMIYIIYIIRAPQNLAEHELGMIRGPQNLLEHESLLFRAQQDFVEQEIIPSYFVLH